jgi:hypothetical protein
MTLLGGKFFTGRPFLVQIFRWTAIFSSNFPLDGHFLVQIFRCAAFFFLNFPCGAIFVCLAGPFGGNCPLSKNFCTPRNFFSGYATGHGPPSGKNPGYGPDKVH